MFNNILDVKGLKVGQVEDEKGMTGCTVVLCEDGATCGVDVRGSAPGTRETDLLDPINMVQKVHAVVLSGGSSFGLESSCGVSEYLEKHNIGFDV
ncbi:MAG: P1 family peptidase, partial [Clostridiales bacterium]|nr:P1 family peptidase [Clostridiales bacterium]